MKVTLSELAGPRFHAALELLDDGYSLAYESIMIRITPNGALECAASSSWDIPSITEDTAREDFARADQVLAQLLAHPEFARRAAGREMQMLLVLDYGNGGVELCKRENDRLVWTGHLPRRDPP